MFRIHWKEKKLEVFKYKLLSGLITRESSEKVLGKTLIGGEAVIVNPQKRDSGEVLLKEE